MKNNNKRSIFSSVKSMFGSLLAFGATDAQEELQTMVDEDMIIQV